MSDTATDRTTADLASPPEDGSPPASSVLPPLVIQGAVKRFRERVVLDGVDLEVEAGRFVGIGGDNGAGKTTLLRLASGFFAPDEGFVSVFGLSHERERRECQLRIGFLSAGDRGLYARLTVEDHLALWARLALIPRAERPPAVARAIERFALQELAPRRVDRISMGQRQRLRLALIFLHDPMLVLLDEPLSSLDRPGTGLLRAATSEVTERGGAVVWCSPDPGADDVDLDVSYVISGGGLRPT